MAVDSPFTHGTYEFVTTGTVPNSLTAVTSVDSWIFQITVANKTGTAATFLVQDISATPIVIIPTVSIGANTAYVVVFPHGYFADNGIKWQAGTASALDAQITGFKRAA